MSVSPGTVELGRLLREAAETAGVDTVRKEGAEKTRRVHRYLSERVDNPGPSSEKPLEAQYDVVISAGGYPMSQETTPEYPSAQQSQLQVRFLQPSAMDCGSQYGYLPFSED